MGASLIRSWALKTSAFFDAVAENYDRDLGRSLDEVRSRLDGVIPRGSHVLDLGIGTGRELVVLDELNCIVTGLDSSERMLEQAKERGRAKSLILGDIWAPWAVDDKTHDVVMALHGTLAHPPNGAEYHLEALANECARVLRPDGMVYFEVPTAEAMAASFHEGYPIAITPVSDRTAQCVDTRSGIKLLAVSWSEAAWTRAFEPLFWLSFAASTYELCVIASPREPE